MKMYQYKILRGDSEQRVICSYHDLYRSLCHPEMTQEEIDQTIDQWAKDSEATPYSSITFNEYQEQTALTAKYPKDQALEYLCLGVASEAGEISGKLKKLIRDGDSKMTRQEWVDSMSAEIGDVLWYLARLSDELGLDLSTIAENNIEKLLDRKARGVIGGSGDNR